MLVIVHIFRAVEPRDGRAHGRLELADDERDAIHEQHEVKFRAAVFRWINPLIRDDVRILLELVRLHRKKAHRHGLAILAERERIAFEDELLEYLILRDEIAGARGEDQRAQAVDDLIRARGLRGDARIQPHERIAQHRLDKYGILRARQVGRFDVRPSVLPEGVDRHLLDRMEFVEMGHGKTSFHLQNDNFSVIIKTKAG